ncbi:MAG: RNA methyltransferase [Fuerstiella sp.]
MEKVRIESLDDPRLDIFRDLKKTNANRYLDLLIAEGTTLVERLLNSDYDVQTLLVTDQKLRNFESRITAGTTVYHMDRDLASVLLGYSFHNGVLAAARRKPAPQLNDVIKANGPSLVFYGDQIIDQQNVGLMIRIAAAFGASAVVLGPGTADPFSRRVLRVSMGNGLFLPIIETKNGTESLQQLKESGHHCCATVLDSNAIELSAFRFPERTVLVFGNETHGISPAIANECESKLTVSMFNGTDSLNVAIAMGIFSFAYRTQQAAF